MTWLVMLFLLLAGAVAQTALPGVVLLGQAKIPVLAAVVLYYALTREMHVMLAAAFLGGLIQDALSPIPLGYSAICFVAVGCMTGAFRRVVLSESTVTQVFFGSVAGAATTVFFWMLLSRWGALQYPFARMLGRTAGTAMLAAVCTPVVFRVGATLDRVVGNGPRIGALDEVEGIQY